MINNNSSIMRVTITRVVIIPTEQISVPVSFTLHSEIFYAVSKSLRCWTTEHEVCSEEYCVETVFACELKFSWFKQVFSQSIN